MMAKKKKASGYDIKSLINYDLFRGIQNNRMRQLNDFFIGVSLTRTALRELQSRIASAPHDTQYDVPQMRAGRRTVKRKSTHILNYIDERVSRSEYGESLVFGVAKTEDFIMDVILCALIAHPRKILVTAKGGESERSVPLRQLLDADAIDEVIFAEASRRMNEVLYSSPTQYLYYFEKVMGFDLGTHGSQYLEIKATRDILVHNDGYANDIYVSKAGNLARCEVGELVPIDQSYFEESIRCFKNIASTIYRGLLKTYGNSEEFAAAVRRHIV
jgi:hypothetical protein